MDKVMDVMPELRLLDKNIIFLFQEFINNLSNDFTSRPMLVKVKSYYSNILFPICETISDRDCLKELFYTYIICYYRITGKYKKYDYDMDELLCKYPEFESYDNKEKNYLLNFRNIIRLSISVFDDISKMKGISLKIAGSLEGSGNIYITGSGSTDKTLCRVKIFETETCTKPHKCMREKRIKLKSNKTSRKPPRNPPRKNPRKYTGKAYSIKHTKEEMIKNIRLKNVETTNPYNFKHNAYLIDSVAQYNYLNDVFDFFLPFFSKQNIPEYIFEDTLEEISENEIQILLSTI